VGGGEHEMTLFVSNLPWHVTDDDLERVFRQFAEVVRVRVIHDPETGRSQGYGFVQFTDEEAARAVRAALDGCSLDGRRLEIRPARPATRGTV
jgi:RNA recognition motif-containing protein